MFVLTDDFLLKNNHVIADILKKQLFWFLALSTILIIITVISFVLKKRKGMFLRNVFILMFFGIVVFSKLVFGQENFSFEIFLDKNNSGKEELYRYSFNAKEQIDRSGKEEIYIDKPTGVKFKIVKISPQKADFIKKYGDTPPATIDPTASYQYQVQMDFQLKNSIYFIQENIPLADGVLILPKKPVEVEVKNEPSDWIDVGGPDDSPPVDINK